jgi:type VI secretion system secreted protein Hcp
MAIVDYFLQIDGIKGESQAHGHKGEIEVLSFSWGVSNSSGHAGGGGGGAGKVSMSDFSVVKYLDSTSPQLFEKCCQGEFIANVNLTMARRAGGGQQDFYKIKLNEVLIGLVQPVATAGRSEPVEQISFKFSGLQISAADRRGQFVSTISCAVGKDQFGDTNHDEHR